ncbi:MAG TPA: DUF4249 family protein [Chryseolinea sp.]
MRRRRSILPVLLILFASACLDRIDIEVGDIATNSIVVNGFITNEPGPYQVTINTAFDIESKESFKYPVSAKRVVLSDNTGISEVLTEASEGIYVTKADGIRGMVGRTYVLKVELGDGRVYESVPDTLLESGRIDSLYALFTEEKTLDNSATVYGFDVKFVPSIVSENSYHLMWKFTGTFQANTNPEYKILEPCGDVTCSGCNRCNYKPLCSGLRNISPLPGLERAVFVRIGPCECCTCWYDFFNSQPLLSDDLYVQQGKFSAQTAVHIPLDAWTFQHRVYAKVTQFTLSRRAFDFWKAVKDQKTAINSLFQPVTGKIKTNFVQIDGPPAGIDGLFFAAGIASKSIFIDRDDVREGVPIPDPGVPFAESCLKLFPYATTEKPEFWE